MKTEFKKAALGLLMFVAAAATVWAWFPVCFALLVGRLTYDALLESDHE